MNIKAHQFYHIHLISDGTGQTLDTVARAAMACYKNHDPIQHIYALVRTEKQLDVVFNKIEQEPGIVLFTMIDPHLRHCLEKHCAKLSIPSVSILDPVISSLQTYLNAKSEPVIGGQYDLNTHYFKRMDALNYTLIHDDGQHLWDIAAADIILIGISRTSKTPTSIYLANRGMKTANIPLVIEVGVPKELEELNHPMIVGLVASTDRIAQIRRNRLDTIKEKKDSLYVDRRSITEEIKFMRSLCLRNNWPVIDVTRKSIEETAASILNLYNDLVET